MATAAELRPSRPKPLEVPIVERAFQLARGEGCGSVRDIERELLAEGYVGVAEHIEGCRLLRSQLRRIIRSGS